MTFMAADKNQTTLITTVRLLEYAAVEHFREVTSVRFGKDLAREYFGDKAMASWRTDFHGDVPVKLVEGYEISLELKEKT